MVYIFIENIFPGNINNPSDVAWLLSRTTAEYHLEISFAIILHHNSVLVSLMNDSHIILLSGLFLHIGHFHSAVVLLGYKEYIVSRGHHGAYLLGHRLQFNCCLPHLVPNAHSLLSHHSWPRLLLPFYSYLMLSLFVIFPFYTNFGLLPNFDGVS